VYALTLMVTLGAFVALYLVKQRLTKEGWSLANALDRIGGSSYGHRARGHGLQPGDPRSRRHTHGADPAGGQQQRHDRHPRRVGDPLMLYMGFGGFALYSFGLTCQLPASMPAASTFLLSDLSLFAPYLANKISTAIQPNIRSSSGGPAAPPSPFQSVSTTATDSPVLSPWLRKRPPTAARLLKGRP
jgi:hypothetical protein